MTDTRPLHRHADMVRIMNPRSIGVMGISPNATSFGARASVHLERFLGPLYRINPKYEEISGKPCFPSIASLPEVPDCVVIAMPRDGVEAAVAECAEAGVGGVVIFASGYAEIGKPESIALQDRLTGISRSSGLRIIGPNCMGFMNLSRHLVASFFGTAVPVEWTESGIGLISQSGSIGFSLSQAMYTGVPFSHVITTGNSCDVNAADALAYLAEEPACRVIACVFEGLSDPSRMIEAAQIARKAGKPVIVVKLGTGEQGAAATMSHTASLAGSHEAYRAAFERTGMVLVNDFRYLIETASFFMKAGRPRAEGVAVVSGSGGMAIANADQAETHRVPLPQPDAAMQKALYEFIPDFGAARNPVDATAMAGRNEGHVGCLDIMLASPMYAAGIFPQPLFQSSTLNRFKLMSDVARRHGKPVCIIWANGWTGGPGTKEVEADPHLALFGSTDRCHATLAAWFRWEHQRRALEHGDLDTAPRLSPASAGSGARSSILETVAPMLTEREAKQVLALYGIPVVEERLTQSAEEAAAAAAAMGYPVVLKVESPDIPHKTEAGVVRINLRTPDELATAWKTVTANAARQPGQPRINGVLVQPMIGAGVEIIVGARTDPQFGPLVVVGMGGILVEVLKDSVVELAPIGKAQAQAMLERLKGGALLRGFRGSLPVDMARLANLIARISEFAADCSDIIESLDINPLICSGNRIVAVDALIVKHSS